MTIWCILSHKWLYELLFLSCISSLLVFVRYYWIKCSEDLQCVKNKQQQRQVFQIIKMKRKKQKDISGRVFKLRSKTPFFLVTFKLSSKNMVIQHQLNRTALKQNDVLLRLSNFEEIDFNPDSEEIDLATEHFTNILTDTCARSLTVAWPKKKLRKQKL